MTNTHIETKSLALTTPVKILYLYKSLITCKQPLPPSTFCPGEGMQKECTPLTSPIGLSLTLSAKLSQAWCHALREINPAACNPIPGGGWDNPDKSRVCVVFKS